MNKLPDTPLLNQLESGPWPSFVTGLKHLVEDHSMMADMLGQLETSYRTPRPSS
jgi:sulfite reductase alpha subunit